MARWDPVPVCVPAGQPPCVNRQSRRLRAATGVYLYWPDAAAYDTGSPNEREEMVGPVWINGERVLEELWRQHPEADPLEVDTLFTDIVETMLTNHLIRAAGELRRAKDETAKSYGAIDNWSRDAPSAGER